MRFIETDFFTNQLKELKQNKHKKIFDDYNGFKKHFSLDTSVCLFWTCYKSRRKNSSIGIGKRWWLRIILLANKDKNIAIPLLIYSKKIQQDTNKKEIEKAMKIVLEQIK